ncbi:MAG TPA: PDZ domain-containing protein, partial [Candidatus Baltobacteraceae bacterium]|nr:PDZ domain-containing protein [Candidatus Baltobacteraceae bacterium]
REQLGLTVQPLTPQLAQAAGVQGVTTGLVVTDVQDGSAAADAGIQPGDVITQVNRKPVQTVAEFCHALAADRSGGPALLLIHRKDAVVFTALPVPDGSKG